MTSCPLPLGGASRGEAAAHFPARRNTVRPAARWPGELRGLALQQAAADLVRCDQLDRGARSAAGADAVAADRLTVSAVVQHRKHLALAARAPVGGFRVRLHRSTA